MKKNTVTQEQINKLYNDSHKEFKKMGSKTLVCACTTPSGFVIIENASCVRTLRSRFSCSGFLLVRNDAEIRQGISELP